MFAQLKRAVIGSPIATEHAVHERLNKRTALAVFSSDALSSVAYATQEILIHLAPVGVIAFSGVVPISAVIVALLLIVGISYRQTISAYPNGGGSYIVAKDNLGTLPGLTAGAALLIDYVLTVAVSISAGVEAAYSAIPALEPYRVWICLAVIALITLANLRGVRESGAIFAIPTYFFVVTFVGMILYGLFQFFTGTLSHQVIDLQGPLLGPRGPLNPSSPERSSWFFLLAAFASGCTAMTGVEAISNGVPAFKKPESANARTTLTWMIVILTAMFVGISFLARQVGATPHASGFGADAVINETIPSQVARTVFHGRNIFFYGVQAATALILVLAANTSYADFPRLTQLIARDRYMPKQFASLGDRLVFSNGILILALLSALLIIVFKASVNGLIPLYAVGVFLSFTLSQSGMVRHWFRLRGRGWHVSAVVNGVGAVATLVVLLIIGSTKFLEGAWLVVLLIPVLVLVFIGIHHHYSNVADQLSLKGMEPPPPLRNTVVVPISTMHRGVVNALQYAKAISNDVTAVHVSDDPEEAKKLQEKWVKWGDGVPLEIIESPYRSLMRPLIKYIEDVDAKYDNDVVTVVLPEFVTPKWWQYFLHNQTSLQLKGALLFNKDIVVTSVPYRLRR
ncbi:MAG: APC family permease [Herpetosiphonaceae bacterium]|nr:APC family permease [Herpetosiphonaceae bacterium]